MPGNIRSDFENAARVIKTLLDQLKSPRQLSAAAVEPIVANARHAVSGLGLAVAEPILHDGLWRQDQAIVFLGNLLEGINHALASFSATRRPAFITPPPSRPPSPITRPPSRQFRCVGDVWHIRFDGEQGDYRTLKGLQHVGKLLAEPNRPVSALDLTGATPEQISRLSVRPTADSVMDAKAISDAKKRRQEIDEELEEANERHDEAKSEKLAIEREKLDDELKKAIGLGGAERQLGSGSPASHVADSVRKNLGTVYGKLKDTMPKFVDHLRRTIQRDGDTFTYRPEAPSAEWDL